MRLKVVKGNEPIVPQIMFLALATAGTVNTGGGGGGAEVLCGNGGSGGIRPRIGVVTLGTGTSSSSRALLAPAALRSIDA